MNNNSNNHDNNSNNQNNNIGNGDDGLSNDDIIPSHHGSHLVIYGYDVAPIISNLI